MKLRERFLHFLHPFLFTLYPILHTCAANLGKLTLASALRSLLVFMLLSTLLLLLARQALKSWQRAALLTSLALVMFFTFGHLQAFLWRYIPHMGWISGVRPFFILWSLHFLLLARWMIFRLREPSRLAAMLNVTGAILLLILALKFAGYAVREGSTALQWRPRGTLPVAPAQQHFSLPGAPAARPDVYYIILDGYGQAQMLQDLYGLDNSSFTRFLTSRGFYVAEDSRANYMSTSHSLASSLNMAYLDELVEMNPSSRDWSELFQLLRDNQAARFFKAQGYRTMAVTNGFDPIDRMAVDTLLGPRYKLNYFEWQLLHTTMLGWALDRYQEATHRLDFHERFRLVVKVAGEPGPKFVFVHMIAPHPPFVFDRKGDAVRAERMRWTDGSDNLGMRPEEYIARYSEQLLYVNRMVEDMIDSILTRSKKTPVIIVQGDHGPAAYVDWFSPELTCLRERFSILNAYLLPGVQVSIPPDITPVNSFRLVLQATFGAGYDPLKQRSYFTGFDYPYRSVDVTERVETCAPLE